MTDRYARIRQALAMGPTPNEWYWTDEYAARDGSKTWSLIGDRGVGILSCDGEENSPKAADATYIAACDPDTIRALLAERDALREALGRILENEAPSQSVAAEYGGYVLDNDLRKEARAALAQEGGQ